MTSFAAVLYVGGHKVAKTKRAHLHVLIHSAANSAEDACRDRPATGEGPGLRKRFHIWTESPVLAEKEKDGLPPLSDLWPQEGFLDTLTMRLLMLVFDMES